MLIDDIRRTLMDAGTDLGKLFLSLGATDLETQAFTTDGPLKRIDSGYDDRPTPAPLDRVGTTWRNWVDGRCVALSLDIDHIDDHPGRGWSTEQIETAIQSSPKYIAWFWSRRGKGVTGVVLFDAPAPTRADQMHLGKRLKAKLQADGFPVEMIDCIGGNCWVWWAGATGRAHMLIRPATETLDELPEIASPSATVQHADGLTDRHRADLDKLRVSGCPPQFDPTTGAWRVHTATLSLIDPKFSTSSPGSDLSHPNAYMFPLGDGAWGVHRYGGASEPTWGGSSTKLNPHLEVDFTSWHDWQQPSDFSPVSITNLIERHPKKSPPLVDGLIRLGETGNIIAPPKMGKSWLVYSLALAVVTGQPWLGFPTRKGQVLLLDNELPPAILANRVPTVAQAMGISDYTGFDVISLRGRLLDLEGVGKQIVDKLEHGQYSLIIADAWYRFSPGGEAGENSNSGITTAFNMIDKFAAQTGAAWALVHHSSKGNQSQKSVTDTGSGAGAQSRATDAHIVLRDHEEEKTVVLEAECRSFIRPEPRVLRWDYPLWQVVPGDPTALRDPTARKRSEKDQHAKFLILETLKTDPDSINGVANKLGGKVSKGTVSRLVGQMTHEGLLMMTPGQKGRQQCNIFSVTT